MDRFYETPDPWGFQRNPDDEFRRRVICQTARLFVGDAARTLDIGAGEGWVTTCLPGAVLHGYELSDVAASRFPKNVERVKEPEGLYDLVVASGVLYRHYDLESIVEMIDRHAGKFLLVCSIQAWEIAIEGKPIFHATWPYREFNQSLRVYEVKR